MDLFEHRSSQVGEVLDLFGLPQRRLVWRFDAHEHGRDIGVGHELHELVVFGEIDRGLGRERQRIAMRLLPGDDLAKHRLDGFLVADQIVVDDEHGVLARGPQRLELG